jgi:hypothetical protein
MIAKQYTKLTMPRDVRDTQSQFLGRTTFTQKTSKKKARKKSNFLFLENHIIPSLNDDARDDGGSMLRLPNSLD